MRRGPLLALVALFALLWFVPLGGRTLIHSDEGRYATLSLGMLQSGDWVTPRLNGLLYFEKPALQYWLGALSMQLFGVDEFAARLWPALAGFLAVLAVGYTAARLWGRDTGVRALAIAAGMSWIIGNSHFLTLDAGLCLFLTLVLCAMLLALREGATPGQRRGWTWLAWAAMAGAVLSKGLVGILIPGCVLLLLCLWERDTRLLRGMRWFSGALILLLLAAPWFVAVSARNPGFAEFFFIHEHFARYLTDVHHREGAWWYYLPLLLAGALPWTGGLAWLRAPGADVAPAERTARRMLLLWSGFVLLFFSVSHSKLPSYILPMFPALALLLAERLRGVSAGALKRQLMLPVAAWAVVGIASFFVARLASARTPPQAAHELGLGLAAGAVLFLAGAALAWRLLGRQRVTAAIVAVALAHLAGTLALMQSHDTYGQTKSSRQIAGLLLPRIAPDTPVFAVRSYDQTLPFYLRRHVTLVDYVDEFDYGERHEPGRWIPELDAFLSTWQSLPQAAAYMSPTTWAELPEATRRSMQPVYQDAFRVAVVKAVAP
ncbi:phospholipid carrier-dependent glycosyltransferase [Xylophilus rhododendri]|uniref:Phospholipid carrier-dependent glycosyltransferase n=1 Tax=Xylophilus rhododendri TaxID=2697032 RepID=A0A857JB90_9BURK|nr:glycosyltransferase family 39 protein [Xylophilus rhododendri]QHJ00330.1 phospholipid carrier-dependent glycosyltransferase [Xylophilus rhododendri]